MLKKSITFKDLDDNPVTEDFYFQLNKAEIIDLEVSKKEGLSTWVMRLGASTNRQEIIDTFKKIIVGSVGRRSDDGRKFIKNQEIIDDFIQTDAYSELLVEFLNDPKVAAEFIAGIVPADLREAVATGNLTQELQLPGDADNTATEADVPAWVKERRAPRQAELIGLSQEDLIKAFSWREELAKEGSQ